jgi:hypothetical protein
VLPTSLFQLYIYLLITTFEYCGISEGVLPVTGTSTAVGSRPLFYLRSFYGIGSFRYQTDPNY